MGSPDKGIILHTRTTGAGPDLVVLHGLFGSGDNWRHQAKMLSGSFTVHTMDARNHGDSPHSPAISYPSMAADVAATCDHLGIEHTHIIGHSMGGKTAMQIALTLPDLINKLIIVDIGPRQYAHHHDQILRGLDTLQLSLPDSRTTADDTLAWYVEDKMVRAFLLKNLQRNNAGSYQLKINIDSIRNNYPEIAAAVSPAGAHRNYPGPTLFIKGATSDYLRSEDRELILALFPKARLKTIDGAGHWPHSEKPDVVFKIIADFLHHAIDA